MNFPRSLFRSRADVRTESEAHKAADTRRPGAWSQQIVGRFLSATIFQIPVAFEDEAGFHPVGQDEAEVRFATLKLKVQNKF